MKRSVLKVSRLSSFSDELTDEPRVVVDGERYISIGTTEDVLQYQSRGLVHGQLEQSCVL